MQGGRDKGRNHTLITCRRNDSGPRQIRLVADENDRFLVGIILPPEVVEDVFRHLESSPVHYGVDDDACVRLVSCETIFDLE